MGEVDSRELLDLQRIGMVKRKTKATLTFLSPDSPCRKIYTVFLISDCYMGIDWQCELLLSFSPSQ